MLRIARRTVAVKRPRRVQVATVAKQQRRGHATDLDLKGGKAITIRSPLITSDSTGALPVVEYSGRSAVGGFPAPPAVVVLQEWWGGANPQMVTLAKHYHDMGLRVLLPDLYRGKSTTVASEAEHLMNNLDWEGALNDVEACAEHARAHGASNVGVVGFCMGGALAMAALVRSPHNFDAGVVFYGIPPTTLAAPERCTKPLQLHFGRNDPLEGFSDATAAHALRHTLVQHKVDHEFYMYDNVGHAFMNDDVELRAAAGITEPPNREVQELAASRVKAFWHKHLGL